MFSQKVFNVPFAKFKCIITNNNTKIFEDEIVGICLYFMLRN